MQNDLNCERHTHPLNELNYEYGGSIVICEGMEAGYAKIQMNCCVCEREEARVHTGME